MRSSKGRIGLFLWVMSLPGVSVAALPDLAITSLDHTPARPVAGEPVAFHVTVRNLGQATARQTSVTLEVKGEPRSVSMRVPVLKPGDEAVIDVPVVLHQSGPYTVSAAVDAADGLPELDESNNRMEHEGVAVRGGVDLIILGLSLTADCRVAVRVRNIGTGLVPASEWRPDRRNAAGIALFLEERPAGWQSLREADPEGQLQQTSGEMEWVSDLKIDGKATVSAAVDGGDSLVETDAQNNDLTRTLTCPEGDGGPPSTVRSHAPLMR